MFMKKIYAFLIVVVAVAAMTSSASAQSDDALANSQSSKVAAATPSILGTWEVTATFPDGFRSKSLMTFAPGADGTAGSVFSTADIDFTLPIPCTNQQGVWANPGSLNFDFTFKGFCYDGNASFTPFGTLKIQGKIKLGSLGNGFSGKTHVVITKTDGTIDFSGDATVRAVRMAGEPLP